MILFPRAVRVYVATEAVNMRRSFEGIDIQRARIAPRWEPPLDARSTHV